MQVSWPESFGNIPTNLLRLNESSLHITERKLWEAVRYRLSISSVGLRVSCDFILEKILNLSNQSILYINDILDLDSLGESAPEFLLTALTWFSVLTSRSRSRLILSIFATGGNGFLDDQEFANLATTLQWIVVRVMGSKYSGWFQNQFQLKNSSDLLPGCTADQLEELLERFFERPSGSYEEMEQPSLRDDPDLCRRFLECYANHRQSRVGHIA